MGKHVSDVNLLSVVMNGNNQTVFIPSDVEDRELPDLVRGGKCDLQVGEGGIIGLPDNGKPVKQRGRAAGCLCANSISLLRVMTCTVRWYLNMRFYVKVEALWS